MADSVVTEAEELAKNIKKKEKLSKN